MNHVLEPSPSFETLLPGSKQAVEHGCLCPSFENSSARCGKEPFKITPGCELHDDGSKTVLDPCCGSRMFWFDREDSRAVFGDNRFERHTLKDSSSTGGSRNLIIEPEWEMDFRQMPFQDNTFYLVVFDPPHLIRNGTTGWLAKKYGKLGENWRDDIRAGFSECFRVLKPNGTMIFKWNEEEVKVSELLALTNQKPLFGNRCGKTAKSHWIVFMKDAYRL